MQKFLVYIAVFVTLLLVQEFMLSHLAVGGYVSVYIFIMLIIMADMEIPGWVMLVGGFAAGCVVDSIEGGAGIFAATATWLAFVRKTVMQTTVGRDIIHTGGVPTSSRIGSKKFILYTSVMVFLWAVPYFTLESLGSFQWFITPLRIVISTIVTTLLIYLFQLPINRRRYNV